MRACAARQPSRNCSAFFFAGALLFFFTNRLSFPARRSSDLGGERLLVPVFGVVVAAELAAGEADIVRDVRMVVVTERAERDDGGLVLLALDQVIGLTVTVAEIPLTLLLAFR